MSRDRSFTPDCASCTILTRFCLNRRSLGRRPALSTLVSANIIPKECSRGVSGGLVERKRRLEREQIKEGLRVWLERKAREIGSRRKEGGVGVLVWRFSRKLKLGDSRRDNVVDWPQMPKKEKVTGLKRFWESVAS